jgi:hypothetical protein
MQIFNLKINNVKDNRTSLKLIFSIKMLQIKIMIRIINHLTFHYFKEIKLLKIKTNYINQTILIG